MLSTTNKSIKAATANTLTAAQAIAKTTGTDVHLLIAGQGCGEAAEAASAIEGVSNVLVADSDALANQLAENLAPLLAKLVAERQITHLLAPATTQGKTYYLVLPRCWM